MTIEQQRLIAIVHMSGKAGRGANGGYFDQRRRIEERKRQKRDLMLIAPPPDWREYFDHYLGRRACLGDHWHALLSLEQLHPCQLVFAALCARMRRFRLPLPPLPPLPRYMQVQFPALQLQRFLRSCVLATAHALATPPASVCRLVHARTRSRWIDCIFVRVMKGFLRRAKVRLFAARCTILSII
jgi:hypothetical protein